VHPIELGVVLAAALAAAAATCVQAADTPAGGEGGDRTVVIQTPQGPIKGKLLIPKTNKKSRKRARTPLRVIVPEQPYEPPTPGTPGTGKP
jgi:hypothetical protein